MAQQDVYRTIWSFNHSRATGPMSTSLDFRLSSVVTPASEPVHVFNLASNLQTYLELNYLLLLSQTITLNGVEVINLNQPIYSNNQSSGQVGNRIEDCISLRAAPIIGKLTGFRGRSYRGRMFLMSPDEGDQSNGALSLNYQTDLLALMDGLKSFTMPNGNIYDPVVYSEKLDIDNIITNFTVAPQTGTVKARQSTQG